MTQTISVDKQAISDLLKIKDKFNSIVESLELMGDSEFMKSYAKAKKQIKNRNFDDWDDL